MAFVDHTEHKALLGEDFKVQTNSEVRKDGRVYQRVVYRKEAEGCHGFVLSFLRCLFCCSCDGGYEETRYFLDEERDSLLQKTIQESTGFDFHQISEISQRFLQHQDEFTEFKGHYYYLFPKGCGFRGFLWIPQKHFPDTCLVSLNEREDVENVAKKFCKKGEIPKSSEAYHIERLQLPTYQ